MKDDRIMVVARAIAKKMVEQNSMLEIWERTNPQATGIGVFDDYDNKFYDCEELARAAIEALNDP